MELKQNSWYAIYYKDLWDTKLPQSLCKFFWGMILALLLFPITYPGTIINLFLGKNDVRMNGIIGFGIFFLGLFSSIAFINGILGYKGLPYELLWGPFVGYMLCSILLGIGIGGYYSGRAVYYMYRKHYPKKYYYKAKSNWFTEGVKSFFGKYCPRITWK